MGRSKMMTQASDTQVGGTHYKDMGAFQPWDVLQHWLTPEEYRGWQKGDAIAYLARERQKGGDTDISKAAHHLQKLVEVLGNKNVSVKVGIDNAPQCLTITDEWIDQVIASMPDGLNGFLKTWGLQQFARAVVDAHRDPAPTPATDDGWIQWHGGECPVPPSTVVQYRRRDGEGWKRRAEVLRWEHRFNSGDIIAYRVIWKAEAPTEAPTTSPAPEICCGDHATCTKPCVPRVQHRADADGWIQHDGTDVCPVPPDIIVTALHNSIAPILRMTDKAKLIRWECVYKFKIFESK